MTINMRVAHTIVRHGFEPSKDFREGIAANNCDLEVWEAQTIDHWKYLHEGWSHHFKNWKSQDPFIAIEDRMVLEAGMIDELIAGLSKFDICLYSSCLGKYKMDPPNDAFFAVKKDVLDEVPFPEFKDRTCCLCRFLMHAKERFKIGYLNDKVLKVTKSILKGSTNG